jgi:uncharacterized protein (TIRG00374 family)
MLHYAAHADGDPLTTPEPPAAAARGSLRTPLVWTLKIAVSAGLLYALLGRVDLALLWRTARGASLAWLAAALAIYLAMILVSAWRWDLLLRAQRIRLPLAGLIGSFLVATFLNNFLPSNIGGDVARIRDTARAAGSKTLATMVVLVDRGIGLLGLVFVAALGASGAAASSQRFGPVGPALLWAMLAAAAGLAALAIMSPATVGRLLGPLRVVHQEWVEARIARLTDALHRFRESPRALVTCFAGAIVVQAVLVFFYAAVARGLHVNVSLTHLAIVVPLSFVVQMLPVSVNGLGVREATFGFYFAQLNLSLESALALSFVGAVLIMLFSTSGAVVYLARGATRQAA